jgi:hypothetical protein
MYKRRVILIRHLIHYTQDGVRNPQKAPEDTVGLEKASTTVTRLKTLWVLSVTMNHDTARSSILAVPRGDAERL